MLKYYHEYYDKYSVLIILFQLFSPEAVHTSIIQKKFNTLLYW